MSRRAINVLDHWLTSMLLVGIFVFLVLGARRTNVQFGRSYLNLSETTKNTVSDLSDPIYITYYSTPETIPPKSRFRGLTRRVKKVLRRYEEESNGNVVLKFKNPAEGGEITKSVRRKMKKKGITPNKETINRAGSRHPYYYYSAITITYRTVDRVIPKVSSLESLEYELTREIKYAKNPSLVNIGLYVPPIVSQTRKGKKKQQDRTSYQALETELNDVGIVERISPLDKGEHFPDPRKEDAIDVLIVAAKRKIPDSTKYALDQYLMRGGKAIIAVDPVGYKPQRGRMAMMRSKEQVGLLDSGMNELLKHYGVSVNDHVLIDQSEVVIRLPRKLEQRSGSSGYGVRRNVEGALASFYGLRGSFRASKPPFLLSLDEHLLTFHPTSIEPTEKLEEQDDRSFRRWLWTSPQSTYLTRQKLRSMLSRVKGSGFMGARKMGIIQIIISATLNYYRNISPDEMKPPRYQSRTVVGQLSGTIPSFYSEEDIPEGFQTNSQNSSSGDDQQESEPNKQNKTSNLEEGETELVVLGDTDILDVQLTSAVRSNYLDDPEGSENAQFMKRTVEYLGQEMEGLEELHAGETQSAFLKTLKSGEQNMVMMFMLLLGPGLFVIFGLFWSSFRNTVKSV